MVRNVARISIEPKELWGCYVGQELDYKLDVVTRSGKCRVDEWHLRASLSTLRTYRHSRSVDGVLTRTVRRVSMDMLTVDLTPCPQAHDGSNVELWGN
jgi:Alanine racemase